METLDTEEPAFEIPGLGLSPEGFTVYLRVRNAHLDIHVEECNFHRSPIALAEAQAIKANIRSDDKHIEERIEEYLEATAQHFLPALQNLAPAMKRDGKVTLADFQVQQHYLSYLKFYDENPSPSAITPDTETEPYLGPVGDYDQIRFQSTLPQFQLSEVEVVLDEPITILDFIHGKVKVGDQILFFKSTWGVSKPEEIVSKYQKIIQSDVSGTVLRTSQVYGAVVNHNGAIEGLLYHWIGVKHVLEWDVIEKESLATRREWASQIRTTVTGLHQIGVVWGDAKAGNVVINDNNDAVVIDLEGGATKGWVDEDKMETKDGDLQGLNRLMSYILDDVCPLREQEKMHYMEVMEDIMEVDPA